MSAQLDILSLTLEELKLWVVEQGQKPYRGLQIFQDGLFFKIPKPLRFLWTGWFALFQLILDNGSLHNRDASVFMVVARKINKTP